MADPEDAAAYAAEEVYEGEAAHVEQGGYDEGYVEAGTFDTELPEDGEDGAVDGAVDEGAYYDEEADYTVEDGVYSAEEGTYTEEAVVPGADDYYEEVSSVKCNL